MKKSIIIFFALILVLGIAGTAFAAANPFADVPAKHWAYDAVSKLTQAGILDGYGDGTYRGERTATRYEMAQATAKAMARTDKADAQMKALIDKLAVEFAAELNNLGVRVAKLEKNASSIKFWGDSRLRWQSNYQSMFDVNNQIANSRFDQRLRLYATADVNDKVKFYGRLMTNWLDNSTYNGSNQYSIYWDYGYFEWTFDPAFKIAIGRQVVSAAASPFGTNGGWDAIQLKFGTPSDRFFGKIGYGNIGSYSSGNGNNIDATSKDVALIDLNARLNKDWVFSAAAYYSTNADKFVGLRGGFDTNGNTTANFASGFLGGYPYQLYAFSLKGNLNPDWNLMVQYFWNGAAINNAFASFNSPLADSKTGWATELWYKGADAAKVGSWGIALNYRDVKPFTFDTTNTAGIFGNAMCTMMENVWGKRGWGAQANYTISKNAIMTFTYENLSANNSYTWSTFNSTRYLPWYFLQMNLNF